MTIIGNEGPWAEQSLTSISFRETEKWPDFNNGKRNWWR